MKKKIIFIVMIACIFNLYSCGANNKKEEYEIYEVNYDRTVYSAYIESKYYKNYILSDDAVPLVSSGDIVEAGQEIYKVDNTNNAETIKRVNKINEINSDIETCNKKITGLISNKNDVIKKISTCSDINLKEQYLEKEKEIVHSIEQLENSKVELQRSLSDLNVDKQYEDQPKLSTFKGQVIVGDGVIELYSLDFQIVYNASQQQVNTFSNQIDYKVEVNDKEIGIAHLKYIIPNDELTSKGTSAYYKVVFDIETSENILRNTVVKIIDTNTKILIPEDYVNEEDNKFKVKVNGEEKEVQLQKNESSYEVISGINEHDVLESYKVKG